jgi:hypothetical protein
MKENINRNRTNFDGYKISYLMISKYWFLGLVEGDGSFFLCYNRAIFSITHKDRQVLWLSLSTNGSATTLTVSK